jgi:hypothetical protein
MFEINLKFYPLCIARVIKLVSYKLQLLLLIKLF